MSEDHPKHELQFAPQIEDIRIMELLGKGGMSLVFKAEQLKLHRLVAVKVLAKATIQDDQGILRFQQEARLTSSLNHPNIVKILSFGFSRDGQPYLVMELLNGSSLVDRLKQQGRLSLPEFKEIFLPLLGALEHAHESGMLHRDIKPANIMICKIDDSDAETIKLVDFGVAKIVALAGESQPITGSNELIGSPEYMSPEQCQHQKMDNRSDLYSVACVMYEALTGELPFSGNSILEVMHKHSLESPPKEALLIRKFHIPRQLAKVILSALAKDPAARPQTAAEFAGKTADALNNCPLEPLAPRENTARSGILARRSIIVLALLSAGICIVCFSIKGANRQISQVPVQSKTDLLTGDLPKQEAYFKKAVARATKNYPKSSDTVIDAEEELADFYQENRNFCEAYSSRALNVHKDLLPVLEQKFGTDSVAAGNCLYEMAVLYESLKNYQLQEKCAQRAVRIRELRNVPEDLKVALALNQLGASYLNEDKLPQAIQACKRGKNIIEINVGTEGARSFNNIQRQDTPESPPNVFSEAKLAWLSLTSKLGEAYRRTGRFAEARDLIQIVVDSDSQPGAASLEEAAMHLSRLGSCLQMEGSYGKAIPQYIKALNKYQELNNTSKIGELTKDTGDCYLIQGQKEKAKQFYERSLKIRTSLYGENDSKVAGIRGKIKECCSAN